MEKRISFLVARWRPMQAYCGEVGNPRPPTPLLLLLQQLLLL